MTQRPIWNMSKAWFTLERYLSNLQTACGQIIQFSEYAKIERVARRRYIFSLELFDQYNKSIQES